MDEVAGRGGCSLHRWQEAAAPCEMLTRPWAGLAGPVGNMNQWAIGKLDFVLENAALPGSLTLKQVGGWVVLLLLVVALSSLAG